MPVNAECKKEAKKAEFSKQIIFYCIFAPNYETNRTDIHISIYYRHFGRRGTKPFQPYGSSNRP